MDDIKSEILKCVNNDTIEKNNDTKLHLVYTMPFYDKNKQKEEITLKQLKYYKYIQNVLINIAVMDFVFVGSEKEKSKKLVLQAGFSETEYYEFDQTPYQKNVLKIIENKYLFGLDTAIKKYPSLDVLLMSGSSDFTPLCFFKNLIKNYDKNIPSIYGINGFKSNGCMILVENDIQNSHIFYKIDNNRMIFNVELMTGILGFNKKMLIDIDHKLILPNGNEYLLEKYILKNGGVVNMCCSFNVNYKISNCEYTSFKNLKMVHKKIEKYKNNIEDVNKFLKFIDNL
jgi:hypothetical protein